MATCSRRLAPDASAAEIERGVTEDLETGEFRAVAAGAAAGDAPSDPAGDGTASAFRAQQRFGQRQVDEDGVGAQQQRGGAQPPVAADRR